MHVHGSGGAAELAHVKLAAHGQGGASRGVKVQSQGQTGNGGDHQAGRGHFELRKQFFLIFVRLISLVCFHVLNMNKKVN